MYVFIMYEVGKYLNSILFGTNFKIKILRKIMRLGLFVIYFLYETSS